MKLYYFDLHTWKCSTALSMSQIGISIKGLLIITLSSSPLSPRTLYFILPLWRAPLTLNHAYQRFRRIINRCNVPHRNSCRRAGYRAVPGWLHAAGGGVRGVAGAVSPTPLAPVTAGMLSASNCHRGFRCWFVSPSVLLFSEQCVWQAWFLKTSLS